MRGNSISLGQGGTGVVYQAGGTLVCTDQDIQLGETRYTGFQDTFASFANWTIAGTAQTETRNFWGGRHSNLASSLNLIDGGTLYANNVHKGETANLPTGSNIKELFNNDFFVNFNGGVFRRRLHGIGNDSLHARRRFGRRPRQARRGHAEADGRERLHGRDDDRGGDACAGRRGCAARRHGARAPVGRDARPQRPRGLVRGPGRHGRKVVGGDLALLGTLALSAQKFLDRETTAIDGTLDLTGVTRLELTEADALTEEALRLRPLSLVSATAIRYPSPGFEIVGVPKGWCLVCTPTALRLKRARGLAIVIR